MSVCGAEKLFFYYQKSVSPLMSQFELMVADGEIDLDENELENAFLNFLVLPTYHCLRQKPPKR